MANQPSSSSTTSASFGQVLEFEKPIAKMEQEIARLESVQGEDGRDYSAEIASIRENLEAALEKAYANLSPWETVQVARHPRRPLCRDYVRMICTDFCELHGDKLFGDDKAMVCGFARIAAHRVMLIGLHKGRDVKERIETCFGCAHPDGYRKALQKIKLAAKFNVPVVCLIDTPGAYPGVESEERGIASAIATNLMELSRVRVPIIACVIGEGGSGGALGIGVADHVAVMRNAYYSVISPEGCAAILWKSGEHAARAANALRLTSPELLRLKLIDSILPEPLGGAHRDPAAAGESLKQWIDQTLRELRRYKPENLVKRRYERLRTIGAFFENTARSVEVRTARPRSRRGRAAREAVATQP